LEVVWYRAGNFGINLSVDRIKAKGKTDAEGRYSLSFLLREDELQEGSLKIVYSVDESQYLVLGSRPAAFYPSFGGSLKRDTTITTNYTIARKAWIKGRVSGESPGLDDTFSSDFRFQYDPGYRTQVVNWFSPTAEFANEVPADQPIEVYTLRIRNGVRTDTKEIISVAAGQTLTYEARF
jgi:hypothetical protein